jgi:hypothetical protein
MQETSVWIDGPCKNSKEYQKWDCANVKDILLFEVITKLGVKSRETLFSSKNQNEFSSSLLI